MIKTEQVPSPRSLHSSREDSEYICKLISHRESHKTSKVIYRVGKWLRVGGIKCGAVLHRYAGQRKSL